MIRAAVLILAVVVGILWLSSAGDPPQTLIEPTTACFTPGPPILGPKPGQPIFPGKRKESRA